MKEILQEYGAVVFAAVAAGILIGYLPRFIFVYEMAGQLFLNAIGG